MIKAVFFDLYHTLIRYEPPREQLYAEALKEHGIEVKPEIFHRPLVVADEFIYEQISRLPLSKRSEQERMALFAEYAKIALKEAGLKISEKLVLVLLGQMTKSKSRLVLFDDVVPALTGLRQSGLKLGLISNVDRDGAAFVRELGLAALLDIVVTSQEVGFNKPQPQIFQEALRRAGVHASEAIYVGDQYKIDVLGANSAGMKGILLDRDGYAAVNDCPVISGLDQLADYL